MFRIIVLSSLAVVESIPNNPSQDQPRCLHSHSRPSERSSDDLVLVERRRVLIDFLKKKNSAPASSQRAIEELARFKGLNNTEIEVLLNAVYQNADSTRSQLAFAETGQAGAALVVHRLNNCSIDDRHSLIRLLGMFEGSAKDAIPTLRKLLADKTTDISTKAKIRITLAQIEGKATTEEQVKLILEDMGDKATAGHVFGSMMLLRNTDWATMDVVKEVSKHLESLWEETNGKSLGKADSLARISIVVGQFGPRAKGSIPILEKFFDVALSLDSAQSVIVAFAIARIDPEKGDRSLRKLFVKLDAISATNPIGAFASISEGTVYLQDEKTMKTFAELLADTDARIIDGASACLKSTGIAATSVFSDVLVHFKNAKGVALRVKLANVLASIASYEQVPILEKLLQSEIDADVRGELKSGVETVKSLNFR